MRCIQRHKLIFEGITIHASMQGNLSMTADILYVCKFVVVSYAMADLSPVAFHECLQPQLIATEQFNTKTPGAE